MSVSRILDRSSRCSSHVLACVVALACAVGCKDEGSGGDLAEGDGSVDGDAATGPDKHPARDGSISGGDGDIGTEGGDHDASTSQGNDAGGTPEPFPPAGKVAMFVVSGHGRTVTSCDEGKNWQTIDAESTDAYNERGLAFGDGVWMQLKGWGTVCSFLRSENGIDWQHLSLADVGLPGLTECGGIVYTGSGFVMVHSSGAAYGSSNGGRTFAKIGEFNNNMEHVREVVGGPPGVILAGGANDPSGVKKNPPHVSVDGGKTWKDTPGCSTLHAVSIAQEGGGAFGGGRMVYVGYLGEVCTSNDMKTWQEATLPNGGGMVTGKVSYDGEQFWVADGGRVFVSKNGTDWTMRKLASGVRLSYVAKGDGVWVGFDRNSSQFYRSTDGLDWNKATTSPTKPTDGTFELYRIAYGYGDPSTSCPLK